MKWRKSGRLTRQVPCVLAPNMSVGVNALFKIVGELARILGEGYDLEILEVHHKMKKDAPSGTALKAGPGPGPGPLAGPGSGGRL